MRIVQTPQNGHVEDSTLSADSLMATLVDGKQISHLQGTGNTRVMRTIAGGPTQTSSSDDLTVDFAPSSSGHSQEQIASAVQRGNVVITQSTPATKPGAPVAASTAHAQMAEYHASTETVTLTGDATALPRLNDGGLDLSAERIVLERLTGDTVATGSLKATYVAGAKEAPLHVVADRGELYRSQQRAVFMGHARLWQQESSIEAPVLEMVRSNGTLIAHGDAGSSGSAVHGVFLSKDAPVRVSSQRLTYSDVERVANFDGSTLVESADARIRADQAVVTLRDRAVAAVRGTTPKPQAPVASSLFPGMSGAVERIVSTGHIVLQQPGRKGTGEKLVYTASDGRFVLTGTPADPPQLVDAARGTITGNSLIFLSRDDSVQVGEDASGTTTTHTRVRK
jgi:lipopolysaccharide export system protein LptA